jgi:hypothetical protein
MVSRQMEHGMRLCFGHHAVASRGITNVFRQQERFPRGPNSAIVADAEIVHNDHVIAAVYTTADPINPQPPVTRYFPIRSLLHPLNERPSI